MQHLLWVAGYGFVSFSDAVEGARVLREMQGKYIGNRPCKLRKSTWEVRLHPGCHFFCAASAPAILWCFQQEDWVVDVCDGHDKSRQCIASLEEPRLLQCIGCANTAM